MTQTTKIAPRHVTDETFEQEVLGSASPILVDFWAPWCGPCHAVAPILEEIAGQYVGRLGVAKLTGAKVVRTEHRPESGQHIRSRPRPALTQT